MERLQKVISKAGIASRRHAEQLILEGRVQVNGSVVTKLGTKVDPQKDHIKVDGKRIQVTPHQIYLLLNKPKGYITSVHDPEGRPTVMDLVADVRERTYPVGRLDYDTEGLLLLTNDGDLAQALMHPRTEIEKTYWAKVKGRLIEEEVKKVERGGISLPEGKTAPCRIRRLRETVENTWIEIILHEGKKRQVRMMMEKIGHPVIKLKRVGYAFLKVGNLPLGVYRRLTPNEVKGLQRLIYERSAKLQKSRAK
jgi:23S rRNA pseudouridine2605 synthase